jgi:GDP-4-dehydro-6-deoxy-D-mannose reductase
MGAPSARPLRVLVTGAHGFVGRYLVTALHERGHAVDEVDRHAAAIPVDVTDAAEVRAVVLRSRPDAIAHLAAQAFVPAAIADPAATFSVNALGTQHLLDAVRAMGTPSPRVLVVSSADVYGAHDPRDYPLAETQATFPMNPYAASKIAAEALALAYARSYGLDVVVTRAFNHIGPGQDERFAVAGFAAQLARVAEGLASEVRVGNLESRRDFLDVRDVCAAYVALLEGAGAAGELYNVASGTATSLQEVLRRLITIAGVPVEVREDPARMRPSDVPLSVGDAAKLRAATGWSPSIPLMAALRAVYDDARARVQVTS